MTLFVIDNGKAFQFIQMASGSPQLYYKLLNSPKVKNLKLTDLDCFLERAVEFLFRQSCAGKKLKYARD